jgi:membrane fusion protein (multidrug efflux system)
VRQSQSKASEAALEKSRVELAEVGQRSVYRKQQASISEQLRREALISETQALDAAEQLSNSQWRISAAEASMEKERADSAYADQVRVAQIANISRQLADLEASRLTARAALETARTTLERMLVRAPVAGRIGSLAQLQIGDLAREGDVVATVIPDDRLQVTAEFSPAEALGRVKPGQVARIRLLGFSSAEFGALEAEVSRVASEPHDGAIRVELLLPRATDSRLPLQHGLPGSVEVCVERVAPWRLLLRSLDRFLEVASPGGPDVGAAPPRPSVALHSPSQGSAT